MYTYIYILAWACAYLCADSADSARVFAKPATTAALQTSRDPPAAPRSSPELPGALRSF